MPRLLAALFLLFMVALSLPAQALAAKPAVPESECLGYYGIFPEGPPLPETPWEKELAAADFAELLEIAKKGNMQAQRMVGLDYARGYGVEQNFPEAAKWMKAAAEASVNGTPDIIARLCLGTFYELGIGVPQDDTKALEWYSKLYYYPFGMLRLAGMHLAGRGTAKNPGEAVALCHKALLATPDYPWVPPVHALWQSCMEQMNDTQRQEIEARHKERRSEIRRHKEANCPGPSKWRTLSLRTEPRKDGVKRPSDEPYKFYVPDAYLTELQKNFDIGSSLILSASYDSLQPFCSDVIDESSNFPKPGRQQLHLYLTRGNATDKIVQRYIDETKDESRWRLLGDGHYPKYLHYFNYKAKMPRDRFVPKENELGVPYVIECKRGSHNPVGCTLHTDYKGGFYVQAHFSARMLGNIPEVYGKVNKLLDQLSTPPE